MAIALTASLWMPDASSQIVSLDNGSVNSDSIRREFDKGPYFGLYKDNYFIFGPSVGHKPTRENTNVKFQISIAQKLTKTTLPWNTYLYLFYTQKVFWNVLEDSMPMTDLNFNPGIGIAKPLFWRNRYIGKVNLVIEHESNGRDGDESRSWNKITLGGSIVIDPTLMVHGKFWIPIIDGVNNKVYWNIAYTGRHFVHDPQPALRGIGHYRKAQILEARLQHYRGTELPDMEKRKPVFLSTILQRIRRRAPRLQAIPLTSASRNRDKTHLLQRLLTPIHRLQRGTCHKTML